MGEFILLNKKRDNIFFVESMVKKIIFVVMLSYSLGSLGQSFIEDSILKQFSPLLPQFMEPPVFREKSKRFVYMEVKDIILGNIDLNSCLKEDKRFISIYVAFWVEINGNTTGHHIIYKDSLWHEGLTFDPALNELLLKRLKALHFDKAALVRADQPVRFWVIFPLKGIKKKDKKN